MKKYKGPVLNNAIPITGHNPIEQIIDSIVESNNDNTPVPVVSDRTGKPIGWVTNYQKENSVLVCEMMIDENLIKAHMGSLFASASIGEVKSSKTDNEPIFEGRLTKVTVAEAKQNRSFNEVKPIE